MQSWGARIKAAISGDVDGSDLRALLAATSPLEGVRQTLADRRLAAELAHLGQEWQVATDLAPLAGRLWLAEAFVTLAGALLDAESEAHPSHPTLLSALSHHHAQALLEPVGPLLIELSGLLADANQRPSFSLPVVIAKQAIAVDASLSFIPVPYVRGLLLAVDRLEGSVSETLGTTVALVTRSPAPAWLGNGIQHLQGELAALDTRLQILRAQGSALLPRAADHIALRQLAADLWNSIDILLRVGQLASAPSLLPGAAAPSRHAATPLSPPPQAQPAVPRRAAAPPSPQAPPPPPLPPPVREEPPRTLPEIAPSWNAGTTAAPGHVPLPASSHDEVRPLPQIEPPPAPTASVPGAAPHPLPEIGAATPHPLPEISTAAPRPLPEISVAAPRPLPEISTAAPHASPATNTEMPRPLPEIGAATPHASPATGTETSRPLPEIGAATPDAPTATGTETPRPLPEIAPAAGSRPAPDAGEHSRPLPHIDAASTAALRGTPSPSSPAGQTGGAPAPPLAAGRTIAPRDRWLLSSVAARHRLRAQGREDQAERQVAAFWEARSWTLSPQGSMYLAQTEALRAQGLLLPSGRSLDVVPYAPIYTVTGPSLTVLGKTLARGTLLAYDYHHDRVLTPAPDEGIAD